MFGGSIPRDVQRILAETAGGWECTDVYYGCSGNFVAGVVLQDLGKGWRIHGNDVTIHSSVIGGYCAGTPLTLTLNPELEEQFNWLLPYMSDPAGTVATMLLSGRLMYGWGKDNPYYVRMRQAYKDQWPRLYEKTRRKVENYRLNLASYAAQDVMVWMKELPRDQAFVSYPPFLGAHNAYAMDYQFVDLLFPWQAPEYQPLDKPLLTEYFQQMTEFKHWMFASNVRWPEFEESYRGRVKVTNRSATLHIYSSSQTRRLVRPSQPLEVVNIPRLRPGEKLGDDIKLVWLSYAQFCSVRSQYMNEDIRPGKSSAAIGIVVSGKLIGVYAFSVDPKLVSWDSHQEGPSIYMLSDFPVAPTDYKRLSKLVLYAALSKESQAIAEQVAGKRIRSVVTTAFSKGEVSMKYRGLFRELTKKAIDIYGKKWADEINPNSPYYNRKTDLNYGSPLGRWTLVEGLAIWKKKYGEIIKER